MEKKSVLINKKVVEKIKNIEVTGDIIVPDIKPDIANIINTNGNAYIYKQEIANGNLRVDGNIDAYVIYLSENGETRCMQTTMNFAEIIDDSNISNDISVKTKVKIENIETAILNERKISVKAIVKLEVFGYKKCEIELQDNMKDLENIQKLNENLFVKSVIGIGKTRTSVKENVAIDNSLEVAEIIKTNIEIKNIENKISYNKVLAKAEAEIKILFLTENERIETAEASLQVMSFIDIEKVTENNKCITEYQIRNMLVKSNPKEMHSISVQIEFEVSTEAYESKEIEVIEDMYDLKDDIKFTKKELEVELDNLPKKEKIRLSERAVLEDVNKILDVDCKANILSSNKSGEFTNYEGELVATFFYETDNRNGLGVKNIKFPFITKMENNNTDLNLKITYKKFTLSGENVDCEVEIEAEEQTANYKKICVVENIEKELVVPEENYKMYVYFVKSGDTIWKIAKKFKVCMDEIIKINELENPDKINVGDRLYIMR